MKGTSYPSFVKRTFNDSQLEKMKKYIPYFFRKEAVGVKSYNNLKITIFVSMWSLGQFPENLIFCQ